MTTARAADQAVDDGLERLARLHALHSAGALTAAEFAEQKGLVLSATKGLVPEAEAEF